jgi:AAA domain
MATITPINARSMVRKYGGIDTKPVSTTREDRGLTLGIYGPGGVGKTTLAATITDSPHGTPALYLDARGNPHVIASYGDRVQVLPIARFGDVEKVRQDLLKDKDMPFKTVILDNVTEMWSIALRDRYGPVGAVDWTKHAATTSDVVQLVRNWIDLAQVGPKLNVIFVFQETPEQRTIRNQEVTRSEVAFNKALQSHVPTLVNFLGRVYQVSDQPPYTRLFDLRPVETVQQSKFQIDPNDEFAKQIPLEIYNPSLASVIDTMRGQQPWPVAKHAKPGR